METMAFVIMVVCVILLVIQYFIAKEFYKIAVMKGFNETKYLVLPFLFSIFGMLLVVALPDRRQAVQSQASAPVMPASEQHDEALPKL